MRIQKLIKDKNYVRQEDASCLLNEFDVAKILGVSVATVRRWRWIKEGPRYWKIGSLVRYSRASLDDYLAKCPSYAGKASEVA